MKASRFRVQSGMKYGVFGVLTPIDLHSLIG